jgi:hypothetical protein
METTKDFYFKTLDQLDAIYKKIGITDRYQYILRKTLIYCYDECSCEFEVLAIQDNLDKLIKIIKIEDNKAYIDNTIMLGGISFFLLFQQIPQFQKAINYFNYKLELKKDELPKRKILFPEYKPILELCTKCGKHSKWIDIQKCEHCDLVTVHYK